MKRRLLMIIFLWIIWPTQITVLQGSDVLFKDHEHFKSNVPICNIEEVKIPTDRQEQYYDPSYGYRYRSINTTLYRYVTCSNVILITGQPLDVSATDKNSIKYIVFEESTIPLVPVGVFTTFTNLSELYVNGSFVNCIHPGAFTGLAKLKKLYLQDNNITKMSKGVLNSLPDLQILDLSNNNIEVIEENTFLGLFSLQILYLNSNKLDNLMPGMFHQVNKLMEVYLDYNLLTDIPLGLFSELNGMFTINLSHNNFMKIDFSTLPETLANLTLCDNQINSVKSWSKLQSIIYLDLSNNNIIDIEILHETLEQINLSGNKIEELKKSVFKQSKLLNNVDLSHNLLKNLNEDVFMGLAVLSDLHLENNQISSVPVGCFRDLQFLHLLNLSSNEITEFEYGTFSGLIALQNLDISNNKLAYLYESTFHDLKNLSILNIKDNLITSFDPHDLLDYSNELETVVLDNNPWVCKSLLNIIKTFEKSRVTVSRGSTQKATHVHGIACVNYNSDIATTFSPYFENDMENASIAKFYAISSEIVAFEKFLNKDFLNSSFYKYFQNFQNSTHNFSDSMVNSFFKYFDNAFKNTTFYKYFEKDFSNSSFFGRFDTAFANISKALNLLDFDLKNTSLYNKFINSGTATQNVSKYFEDGFRSSGFYKYFAKDFSNSEFFRYFNKTLQMKVDSNLLKIRTYFDDDFKNSTFFKFFRENNVSRFNSNSIFPSNSSAYVERLTDNTAQSDKENLVSKISELTDTIKAQEDAMQTARTGSAAFNTIVIIILLAITMLLTFKHIRSHFNRSNRVSVSENTSESRIQIAEAEMELT